MLEPLHTIADVDHSLSQDYFLGFSIFEKALNLFKLAEGGDEDTHFEDTAHFTMSFNVGLQDSFFVDFKILPSSLFREQLFSLLVISQSLPIGNYLRIDAVRVKLQSSLGAINEIVMLCLHLV